MGQLLQYEQQLLKETNLINAPFSELNLDGIRSPTEIVRKNLVLHEGLDYVSQITSTNNTDLQQLPSPALDLLHCDHVKANSTILNTCVRKRHPLDLKEELEDRLCASASNYTAGLEVVPSPGSDDVPSPTGSEQSSGSSSDFYVHEHSAPSAQTNKPSTLNLDFQKIQSRDFTLELGLKKKR